MKRPRSLCKRLWSKLKPKAGRTAPNYNVRSQLLRMIGNSNAIYLEFIAALEQRFKMQLPPVIQEQLEFEEFSIRKDYDNTLIKDQKRKNYNEQQKSLLTSQYVFAFGKLSRQERVELYRSRIRILAQLLKNTFPKVPTQPSKRSEVYIREPTLRTWKRKLVFIDAMQPSVYLQKENKVKRHQLSNYICRNSNNLDYFSLVLQAVNDNPKGKYKTIHLGFVQVNQMKQVYQQMKVAVQYGIALKYAAEMGLTPPNRIDSMRRDYEERASAHTTSPDKTSLSSPVRSKLKNRADFQDQRISRIIQDSFESENVDSVIEDNGQRSSIIQRLISEQQLEGLLDEQDMTTIEYENSHRLLQDNFKKNRFKMFLTVACDAKKAFVFVTNPETIRNFNPEVDQFSVKNVIRSENTAVLYMKLKSHSLLYRPRDFLFLRHAFRRDSSLYLIDKSIQNQEYPVSVSIVRGDLVAIWGFIQNKQSNQTLIILDITLNNQGILNQKQNTALILTYLQKFYNLQSYAEQNFKNQDITNNLFSIKWDVKPKPQTMPRRVTVQLEENLSLIKQNDFVSLMIPKESDPMTRSRVVSFASIDKQIDSLTRPKKQSIFRNSIVRPKNQSMHSRRLSEQPDDLELQSISRAQTNLWIPLLDNKGMAVINWQCLKVRHKLSPWPRALIFDEDYTQHHLWRGEWKHDDEQGGLWYKDQAKMEAQKKVLSFVVKKMGSNLLSGKGVLSMSLPVDIFSTESNLERLARTFLYAPLVLESASKLQDPAQQLKQVVILGLTNSLLYITMQKPFNPVLGETFQGSINGCPIYLEQVSHHPPIASILMLGRGYRIHGSIESKMQIGMNSGCGTNDGNYVVEFDNGTIIKFRTPGGQISGLTFGDRKLNIVGRGFYWSPNKDLMLELVYNPHKKGFFSMSKQTTPTDYFQGTIKKVNHQFIGRFQAEKNKVGPTAKDVLDEYSTVDGIWDKQLLVDGKTVFVFDKEKYLKLQYQPNPIPSDANYRQDIIYRRLSDFTRSQNDKERIEVRQRMDKKLREAIHGKSH